MYGVPGDGFGFEFECFYNGCGRGSGKSSGKLGLVELS